jgi:putative oxidoreductase
MSGIWGIDPGWGIAAVRIAVGLILLTAGWGKLMAGTEVVAGSFARMGIPVAAISGPFIMLLEVVGGALLILGIATRWLGLLVTIQFIVATFYVKLPSGGFNAARLDLMLLAGAILLFLAGSGRAAVDAVWLEGRRGTFRSRRE